MEGKGKRENKEEGIGCRVDVEIGRGIAFVPDDEANPLHTYSI